MATKNITPRATNEGGIGTSSKKWASAYFHNLFSYGKLIFDPVTFDENDATPDVSGGVYFITNNSSSTSITDFDSGVAGQIIIIEIGDSNTDITDTDDQLELAGDIPLNVIQKDIICFLKSNSGHWEELFRHLHT